MNEKKPIAVNGRFLSQKVITGVQRYSYELLKALDEVISAQTSRPQAIEVLAPQDSGELPGLKHFQLRRVGTKSGHAWEQIELPRYCRGAVLFTPSGGAPLLHDRNIITIHDAAVFAKPEAYSFAYRSWYKTVYRVMAKRALHILTDSDFSRDELIQRCGTKPANITTVHLGCDHVPNAGVKAPDLERYGLSSGRYVLAVSSRNPNKNFAGIMKAAELLNDMDLRFAIVGAKNARVFGDAALESHSNVVELGYIDDEELFSLFSEAACFVFPSFYEGFGLPPLEAMRCSCPVVVSNAASLPEVCGDAALYCDPADPKSIAEQVRAIATDQSRRADLIRRGTARTGQFHWKKAAEETWGVLSRFTVLR